MKKKGKKKGKPRRRKNKKAGYRQACRRRDNSRMEAVLLEGLAADDITEAEARAVLKHRLVVVDPNDVIPLKGD